MKSWFERFPGRLEYELNELLKAGYSYSLDEELKAKGQIVIEVDFLVATESHKLLVRYPDLYPWLPFEILGPTLPPGRHVCPSTGLLCLMEQPHSKWSSHFTLHWALESQVKALVRAHLDAEDATEAREGQQFSGYYNYTPDSIMLTSDWQIPAGYTHGRLLVGMELGSQPEKAFRGAVLELQDISGNRIAALDENFNKRYRKVIRGRWARVSTPPDGRADGLGVLTEAIKNYGSLSQVKLDSGIDVVGLLFSEESAYKTPVENWLFTLRTKQSMKNGKSVLPVALIRADSIGKKNLLARVPSLKTITEKKVLLVGAGAVGSMIAWQLARAGLGNLSLADPDHVQVGNLPRWTLGLPAVGKSKVKAIAENLWHHYPNIKIGFAEYKFGTAQTYEKTLSDSHILNLFMEGSDLVIDATAEKCLSMALSELCREKTIPYLWATSTPGSRGGVVGRILPNNTEGCWKCFQYHMTDGTIVTPQKEEQPGIQPKGCFHPTFTGTGFDMDNVALAASRLAISTLCTNEPNGYPKLDWDVSVLNLWDDNQAPILPTWTPYILARHQSCLDHA